MIELETPTSLEPTIPASWPTPQTCAQALSYRLVLRNVHDARGLRRWQRCFGEKHLLQSSTLRH